VATTRKPSTSAKTSADPALADTAPEEQDSGYVDEAAKLAADTRELAEKMRDQVGEVVDRCRDLQQNNEPGPQDFAAANGVRRIPMAVADVARALDALVSAAADLARHTAH